MTHRIWAYLFAVMAVGAYFSCSECQAQKRSSATARSKAKQRAAADQMKDKKVPSLQKILSDMPKDLQPNDRNDDEGNFARIKANEWLSDNLPGRPIDFKVKLKEARLGNGPDGQYSVEIALEHVESGGPWRIFAGTVRSGGTDWGVHIIHPPEFNRFSLTFDEAAARRLLGLRGKDVTITGVIAVSPGNQPPRFLSDGKNPNLSLYLTDISLLDFEPPKKVDAPNPPQLNDVAKLQDLLNQMPLELQPRDSKDEEGMFARDKANKWLSENLVGQAVQFNSTIKDVVIEKASSNDLRYRCTVQFVETPKSPFGSTSPPSYIAAGKVRCGGVQWSVVYSFQIRDKTNLGEVEAKRWMQLKGRTVTVNAKVSKSSLPGFSVDRSGGKRTEPKLSIRLSELTVDGLDLPAF